MPEKKPLGNVMLTGATGFLRAHVLHQLLEEERGKVYCLVRSGKDADCGERLKEMLRYYFGSRYDGEFAAQASARILPIASDIGQESLTEWFVWAI